MKSLALKFYEHASVPEGGAMYICRKDDPRISDALGEAITVPCVVARDLAAFERGLTLLRIAELWEESAPYRSTRRASRRLHPSLLPPREEPTNVGHQR